MLSKAILRKSLQSFTSIVKNIYCKTAGLVFIGWSVFS